jgi:hypothetical protein
LIDLGSDNFEFWHYIEPIFLTADDIGLFWDTLPFAIVDEDIWHKIFLRVGSILNQFSLQRLEFDFLEILFQSNMLMKIFGIKSLFALQTNQTNRFASALLELYPFLEYSTSYSTNLERL